MKKILLLILLAVSPLSYSAEIQFRDAPIKEVADQVSKVLGRTIIIPSNAQGSVSLYAPSSMTNEELLKLFYSSLLLSGFDYVEDGRSIIVKPFDQVRSTNEFNVYTFNSVLPDLGDFLPDGSKSVRTKTQTFVRTTKPFYSVLVAISNSVLRADSDVVTRVFNVQSVKPSDLVVLAGEGVKATAFDNINRLVVRGHRTEVDTLAEQIRKLDSSIKVYQVDLVIVSAAQDFNKEYNLDLTLGTDFFNLGLGGLLSAKGSAPYVHQDNYNLLLNWIRSNRQLSIVQKPNLAVNDGQKAKLLVGQEVPFETSTLDPESVTTRINTVERKDVGLSLNLSLNSLNNGQIRLVLDQQLSNISKTQLSNSVDLITDKQQLSTVLDLYPNRFYLIGGLSYRDQYHYKEHSPLFDGIPILSDLTTDTVDSSGQRDLLIFIQVHDLKHPVAASPLS
ncbi:hypothetical protein [Thiomicrorhabdus cannonii]|uniref:hypothetical protein n=1 Tax=Thiomicrorhabdus cannonii TaxID=2748011 RepID=UPI0015B999EE|nr:hypothetical protein [Thiomicrorhabdus cannonii]